MLASKNCCPILATLTISVVGIVVTGCSQSGMESQVSGQVTLDGRPIGPGVVVFANALPGGGNPSDGAIQPDGHYKLRTANTKGLYPGKYKVSVSVIDEPTPPPGVRNMTPGKQLVPEKYTDVSTSDLEFEVKPGSNTINIPLSSKAE